MMTVIDYIQKPIGERLEDSELPIGAVSVDDQGIVESHDIDWRIQQSLGDNIGHIHEIDVIPTEEE